MKKLAVLFSFCAVAAVVHANTVWKEDFTDVSDWAVVNDPGGNSQISSDGSEGYLRVTASSNQAAFAPAADVASLAPFNPDKKGQYTMTFTVEKVSPSCSYHVALDEFNAENGGGYIGTVWQVFPSKGSTTTSGTFTVELGDFKFDPSAKYIIPKITVNTGSGDQTVKMDLMRFDYNP